MIEKRYFVPAKRCRTEFIERKSRFITTLAQVNTVEEAEAFLAEIKAEFPDATHNCAAYRIKDPLVERFFDDGEPGGTAGMPMLDVLKKQELFDVASETKENMLLLYDGIHPTELGHEMISDVWLSKFKNI